MGNEKLDHQASRFGQNGVIYSSANSPLKEFGSALHSWPTWVFLSLNDIRTKYRRTTLGPWWLVVGTGTAMTLMAIVWSILFQLDWRNYLPYMMVGLICWQWMSSYVTQSCELLGTEFSGLLVALPTPPAIHILRFVMRGFFLFLHYLPVWFLAALVTGIWPTALSILFLPLGIAMILITALAISTILGIAGARYRDLHPAVSAIMTPMMMLTPVIWQPQMLGEYGIIVKINPFAYYLSVVRDPLLGRIPEMQTLFVAGGLTLIVSIIALLCYRRYRTSLTLWV